MAATPPGSLALIGGRLEDGNIAVYGEMHRLSGGRILVFPTASAEPKAVGAGDPRRLPHPRLRGRRRARSPPATPAASPIDPALVARVAACGSVYFTGGDQAKITAARPEGAGTPLLAAIRARSRASSPAPAPAPPSCPIR